MITNYTLTGKRISGYIEIEYLNTVFNSFKLFLNAPLTELQHQFFLQGLPHKEAEISKLESLGFTISIEKTNQKIALFCSFYMEYEKRKYLVTKADSGKIKHIKVSEDVLKGYFTSINNLFKNKRSISNLVNFYNELLSEIAAGSTAQYPNGYDRKFESHLTEKDKPAYWSHLRSLGLTAKKDRLGNVTDWV